MFGSLCSSWRRFNARNHHKSCKIVVVGDGSCGKTCLLSVYSQQKFPKLLLNNHLYKEYKPTVFENYLHNTTYGSSNKPIEIGLWDTAGQEDYDRLRSLSYSGADVILLCFTIEKPSSLQNIMDRWFPEVRHFCARTSLLVVGLKSDLRSQKESMEIPVSVEQAQAVARTIHSEYIECSAKNKIGVDQVFERAIELAVESSLQQWLRRFCMA